MFRRFAPQDIRRSLIVSRAMPIAMAVRRRHTEGRLLVMPGRFLIGTALVVALSTLSAQQAGTGVISGRAMDRTRYALPGVTVTATGAVRREVVSLSDGEYRIGGLPPGRYTITAQLSGFETETHAVDIKADEERTIDLLLRLGCLGGLDPPLTVHFPFDQMLSQITGVAYVRIREVGDREKLLTDTSCLSVRSYIAEPLALINIALPQGDETTVRFYGNSWDPGFSLGDELITFLYREETIGTYHEWDADYRMPIRDGRLSWARTDWSTVANGDPVEDVLNNLRAALGRKPAP